MSEERRRHARITFDCEMAIEINGEFYSCALRNISESGALAQVKSGDISQLKLQDEGMCFFDYQNHAFEGNCRVARVAGNSLAILFWGLDVSQGFFIRELVDRLNKEA